jgi:hypothetical protein
MTDPYVYIWVALVINSIGAVGLMIAIASDFYPNTTTTTVAGAMGKLVLTCLFIAWSVAIIGSC